MNNFNHFLFDVETTGLKPEKDYTISIGVDMYNNITNKKENFYELLNWKLLNGFKNFEIPEDTIKVHGITNEIMMKDGLNPIVVYSHLLNFILNFIKDSESKNMDVIVAFNLPFDLNMTKYNLKFLIDYCNDTNNYENIKPYVDLVPDLKELYDLFSKNDKNFFIDSLIVDRIFHFEVEGEKVHHNLRDVGLRYGLEEDQNAHNAMSDTDRMLDIYKCQLNEIYERGLSIDQKFEDRLKKKYDRIQTVVYKKKQSLDYLGNIGD